MQPARLVYNKRSPYVRKVLVLAHETGLADRIEIVPTRDDFSPIAPDPGLAASNPLGKIPTLILADGSAIYDSPVICEYLDAQHDGPRMIPEEPARRWRTLTRAALADGILDTGVGLRYERLLRPEQYRWGEWIDAQMRKVHQALDVLESDAAALDGPLDVGAVAVGCALGYLDFRFADEPWREGRPALGAWYERFAARASMRATEPG